MTRNATHQVRPAGLALVARAACGGVGLMALARRREYADCRTAFLGSAATAAWCPKRKHTAFRMISVHTPGLPRPSVPSP